MEQRILVLCDDIWHPAEVVEKGLSFLFKEGLRFDFVKDAKDILTEEMLLDYPVILCCKGNNMTSGNPGAWFQDGYTEVGPGELRAYVERGGGFVALHAGLSFRAGERDDYVDFVGSAFEGHPKARFVVEHFVVKGHPVVKGVSDFGVRDEHYQLSHLAEDAEVFLESASDLGGRQVSGYARTIGKGRLCALTPGHILGVWENRSFQTLLINAIEWCGGK